MKNRLYIIAIAVTFIFGQCKDSSSNENGHDAGAHSEQADQGNESAKPASPRLASMAMVGSNHVHIDYSAPSVRGRIVWGGLVAYDQVWVTGAHKATNINFNKDLKIAGEVINAGKYAIFTIPGRESWTVIINKNWDQHLADDYDESEDVVRFTVKPESLHEPVEQLSYEVSSGENANGMISISWSKIRISFPVESME